LPKIKNNAILKTPDLRNNWMLWIVRFVVLVGALSFLASCGAGQQMRALSVLHAARRGSSGGIYVSANHGKFIALVAYSLDANGNVPPLLTLGGPATHIIHAALPVPMAVFSDGTVALGRHDGNPYTIDLFASGLSGNVPPFATIRCTRLGGLSALAVDEAGTAYASYTSLPTYASSIVRYPARKGTCRASNTITGPATGLNSVSGLAVRNGQISVVTIVSPQAAIESFPANASGNIHPSTIIAGSQTGLVFPSTISVDASGSRYVADAQGGNGSGLIEIFAPQANGNVAPVRTITSYEATGVGVSADGRIFVAGGTEVPYVAVFAANAFGNAHPLQLIEGRATKLGGLGILSLLQ
jgi:hypothetical protein